MKKILLFGSTLLLLTFASCDESADSKETTPPYINQPVSSDTIDFPIAVNELIKTDVGVFRGVTFGMPAEKVKVLEDSVALDEETDLYLDYLISYNFEELETAEIIYHLDDKKCVSEIETVVYPKSKKSQKTIFEQLTGFYNSRYGPGLHTSQDTIQWKSELDNLTLSLTKVDALKVHDISLIFTPIKPEPVKKANL